MPTEPTNLSIIRECLRKSGSTLVFEVHSVTDYVLKFVIKYLPERKGTYKITVNENGNYALHDCESKLKIEQFFDAGFEAEIDTDTRSDKLYKYGMDNTYYAYRNKITGYSGVYECGADGNVISYKEGLAEMYVFTVKYSGEIKFECYKFDALETASRNMHVAMCDIRRGFNIKEKTTINYTLPNNKRETGPILYYKYKVDFTDKDIVNACLQIKPKNNCVYDFHIVPPKIIQIGETSMTNEIRRVRFDNNNIIIEEARFKGVYYNKSISDDGQCCLIVHGENHFSHQHCFNKEGKLLSIVRQLENNYNYEIRIVNDTEIVITQRGGNKFVDAEDIAVAFGKSSPPQYKFEYLVSPVNV